MTSFKLFRYDIKNGIIQNWLFLFAPLCALLLCCQCCSELRAYDATGTWAVYIMYLFKGSQIIPLHSVESLFQLPVFWLLILLVPLFITLQYPFRGLSDLGIQMLLRSINRQQWWFSKCVWNLLCTVVYFLILYATVALFCIFTRIPINLETPWQPMLVLFQKSDIVINGEEVLTRGQTAYVLLLLPFLTTATLDMLEMLLSLLFRPVYSFLITVALVAASSYTSSPILFPNFANLARCGTFIDGWLDVNAGLCICLVILVASAVFGAIVFRRRDILPNYKEF